MSGMYDEVKISAVKLTPHQHEERGPEHGKADNPVKFIQAAEQRARERQVAIETVRLVRQDLIHCYRKEGVNHFDNCLKEKEAYYNLITKHDYGRVQPKWKNERMYEK